MNDPKSTKTDLGAELERLRRRIAELESLGAGSGRGEQELRESLLRQHAILSNIPDIAWLKDRESRFIAVNIPFGEACGVAPADLVGKTDYDIWPRDLAEGYRADDAEVMRTGQRKRVEERLIGPDGRESWIETIKTPILDAKGEVIGTTGIARDITGRKQADEKLRVARERYRSFFENAAVAVAIVDQEGRVVEANDADCRFLGYSRSELIGMHFTEFTYPQDMDLDVDLYRSLISGQRQGYEIEKRYLRKDGEVVWGRLAVSLIRDNRGLPLYTLVVCVDITDRKRAEEALYLKNYVFDVAIAANSIADTNGVITQANQAFLANWGYSSKEEVIGKQIPEFLQNADEAAAIIDALNASGKWEGNYTARKKDGSTFTAFGLATVLKDEQGRMIGYQSSVLDVTESKRTQEALRASEHLYRSLFETMAQGVVYHAQDGRIISANPAAERILGVSLDQMQGRTSMDPRWRAISEDGSDFPGDQHPAMEALRTGKPVHDAIMGVFHPGRNAYRWILVNAVPEFLPGETRPYQVYATFMDITDRRRAEEALRESEEKFRSVFDTASDGILLVDPRTKRFVLGNATIARMLGVGQGDLPNMQVVDIHPAEALPYVFHSFEKVARGETLFTESIPVLRKDGSIFFADIATSWIMLKGVTYMAGFFRDITERKRAQEALRESEERFRTLLARVDSVALQGFGPDGVVHYWNRASELLYGYTAEEALGRNILDLIVPAEARTAIATAVARMAETGSPLPSSEASLLRKDGQPVTVYANYAVVHIPGSTPELYCIDIDITDRKKAEQERLELERRLLHSQKLESLGVLAGGIAHDFNNLLMAILGNLDLALRNISPVSPARVNIEQSAQAARRATDLTRQMLAYSGKGRFVVKAMDLSELVEENAHLMRASVARTAALDLHLDRSLPPIEADAGQVQQVIMNLITNASEAIGEGAGRITITTGVRECDEQCLKQSRLEDVPPAGRFVMLEVSDTGCGMDAQTQERLFDPFFSTKALGRGLGMSAILGIVRGHRGAVFVESAVGAGTTVRILFPALAGAQTAKDAAAEVRAPKTGAPALSGTVLVVDDEEIVRNVCRMMVQSFGMQVLTASDGREAVEVFRQNADRISHVILDLTMPNMDGMTAFKELVRIRPGVKVILCSGYDEQDSVQRLSGQGLAGFIQKPYSLAKLRDALEKAGGTAG